MEVEKSARYYEIVIHQLKAAIVFDFSKITRVIIYCADKPSNLFDFESTITPFVLIQK